MDAAVLAAAPLRLASTAPGGGDEGVHTSAVEQAAAAVQESGILDTVRALAASPGQEVEVITAEAEQLLSGSGPVPMLAQALVALHEATGQPWWVVIAGAVCAIRFLAVPASLYSAGASSRMKSVAPFQALYRKQQMEAARRNDRSALAAASGNMQRLNKEAGVSNLAMFGPIIFQIGSGIWLFMTLRRMGLHAEEIPGFVTEGLPWAADLGATEYTLPALSLVLGLGVAEMSQRNIPQKSSGPIDPKMMLNISRGLSVFGGAIMTTLPSAVVLSAVITSGTVIGQMSLMHVPAVQRAFGFAKGWPDVEYAVPSGWDKAAAERLAVEHEAEVAKRNPFAQMVAKPKDGEDGATAPVRFTGLKTPDAPPPPEEEAAAAAPGAEAAPARAFQPLRSASARRGVRTPRKNKRRR